MDLLAAASTLSHRAPMSVSVPDNSQSERDAALCCENSHTTSELAPIVDAKPEPACESAPASVSHSLLATLSSQSQHSATFQPPKPSMMHQLPQPTPSPAFIYPQLCTSLPAASLQNWNISGLSAATFSPVPNATPPFHPVPIPAPPSSSSSQCANNVTKKRPGRKCTNEEPANKRIAQNRIAQKNHRERKLQYTQNLEAQVQNLTTLLHQSRGEVAGLCTYVQHLKASSACIHSCIKSGEELCQGCTNLYADVTLPSPPAHRQSLPPVGQPQQYGQDPNQYSGGPISHPQQQMSESSDQSSRQSPSSSGSVVTVNLANLVQ